MGRIGNIDNLAVEVIPCLIFGDFHKFSCCVTHPIDLRSNVFNILSVLGFSSVISPINSSGVGYIDLSIMMLFAIIILPMSKSGFVLKRFEGAILLAGYFAYIIYLGL